MVAVRKIENFLEVLKAVFQPGEAEKAENKEGNKEQNRQRGNSPALLSQLAVKVFLAVSDFRTVVIARLKAVIVVIFVFHFSAPPIAAFNTIIIS